MRPHLLGLLPEHLAAHLRAHGVGVRDAEARRIVAHAIAHGRDGFPAARPVPRKVERAVDAHVDRRPIEIVDEGATKRISIGDRLKAFVTQIRGRDKTRPVLFENIFNQIHAPTQVLALGDTEYDDGVVVIRNTGSHGLFSNFDWAVGSARS